MEVSATSWSKRTPGLPLRWRTLGLGLTASLAVHAGALLVLAATARPVAVRPLTDVRTIYILYAPAGGTGFPPAARAPAGLSAAGAVSTGRREAKPKSAAKARAQHKGRARPVSRVQKHERPAAAVLRSLPSTPRARSIAGENRGDGAAAYNASTIAPPGTTVASRAGPAEGPGALVATGAGTTGHGGAGGVEGAGLGGSGAVFSAGQVAYPPVVVSRVIPVYPPVARARGLDGEVVLRAIVGCDGHVEKDVIVAESSPLFDRPAVEALLKWRFEPARDRDGRPVRVMLEVPIKFRLR